MALTRTCKRAPVGAAKCRKSKTRTVLTKRVQGKTSLVAAKGVSKLQRSAPKLSVAKPRVGALLLDLGADLIPATLVRRPSIRNKSPWVADVRLKDGRLALAHCPAMDMGGLCVEGSNLLLKRAVDSKGNPISAKAVGVYGTPKCEFITQLVRVDEPETKEYGTCWCGAHPSVGEKLAHALLEQGIIKELPSQPIGLRKEVTGVAGCNMRADFVLEHSDTSNTVVEVKTVLNTDYNAATAPKRKECVYLGPTKPYQRAGIFPWGRVSQVGPEGEKVVSARAIKHVDELASIARGVRKGKTKLRSMMLFVVVRHDVKYMRLNQESCPSFVKHAEDAAKAGVMLAAHKIRWGVGKELGRAFWDGPLKVTIPSAAKPSSKGASQKRTAPTSSMKVLKTKGKK